MWPRGDHHAAVSSAQGGLPSYSVHKNDDFVALLTIHPINPGHVMVVPKAHVESCYGDPLRLYTPEQEERRCARLGALLCGR